MYTRHLDSSSLGYIVSCSHVPEHCVMYDEKAFRISSEPRVKHVPDLLYAAHLRPYGSLRHMINCTLRPCSRLMSVGVSSLVQ